MTDGALIFGLDVEVIIAAVGVIAAMASSVAAIFAFCVARRSFRFQNAVAKNTIFNLQYRFEIEHWQKVIDSMTELITYAIDINHVYDSDEVVKLIYNINYSVASLKSVNSTSREKIHEWLYRYEDDNVKNAIYFQLRRIQGSFRPLDKVSDSIDVFEKRRDELIEIKNCRFREINDELWS